MRRTLMLGVTVAALCGAGVAGAQEAKKKDGGAPLGASFDKGLVFGTVDGANEVKLGASTQLDGRWFPEDHGAPDGFDIRRARLDVQARLLDFLDLRIQAALEDSPYIRNAFLNARLHDAVQLRVGQMKVPFSSSWLTLDNQVNFLERATSEPIYPFFDRGAMVWGEVLGGSLVWNLGVFNGAGVDLDATKSDIDDGKEGVARLFAQPFRALGVPALEGLYLVAQGSYEDSSAPARRFDGRGTVVPSFETLASRFRFDQTIGTSGRVTDFIRASIDRKARWGGELHYLLGPLAVSAEVLAIRYSDVDVHHDLLEGSRRRASVPVATLQDVDGTITSASLWVSCFLTGEKKKLENWGWKQPAPLRPFLGLAGGPGAWEVLARVSYTRADDALFASERVDGFAAGDIDGYTGPTPGAGTRVTAAVLDGAPTMFEATAGVNWTWSYHVRLQLNYVFAHAPDFVPASGTTAASGGLLSGGNSDQWDPTVKSTVVESEHMLGLRFIFRL